MLVPVLLYIVGLLFLIKGGDWFVDGASALARRFHLPELLIAALDEAEQTQNEQNAGDYHSTPPKPGAACAVSYNAYSSARTFRAVFLYDTRFTPGIQRPATKHFAALLYIR